MTSRNRSAVDNDSLDRNALACFYRVGLAMTAGITLDVELSDTIHDRSILANSGWRINLGRGLDIFQFVSNDTFDIAAKIQEYRQVKAFGITYIKEPTTQPID